MSKNTESVLEKSNREINNLTRESIETALFLLVKEKPIDKITITELTKKAGVSRMAFYRNYSGISDVCFHIGKYIRREVSRLKKKADYDNNAKQFYIDLFATLKKNESAAKILFSSDYGVSLYYKFEAAQTDSFSTAEDFYKRVAHEAALKTIVMEWFHRNLKETPEKMGEICLKCLGEG